MTVGSACGSVDEPSIEVLLHPRIWVGTSVYLLFQEWRVIM